MTPDPQQTALQRALGVQYEVLRLLGKGGMGAVYLGRETALERQVAIKVLPPELAGEAESRERFRREARIAAKLTHPNIIPLYTFGETEGLLFFVMGFVRGESLGVRLQREGRIPPTEATRILSELADALDYAHRQGVVHRDIKPDNILLEEATGRAMLADFGVARAGATGSTLTEVGAVVGTPHYMSPEQASGERQLDGRSDLYSLGVLGYRMVSGRLPFEAEGLRELLTQHVIQEPAPLSAVAPDVPMNLQITVMRALRKEPVERWQDGASLRAALNGEELPDHGLTSLQRRLNLGLFKVIVGFLAAMLIGAWAWTSMGKPQLLVFLILISAPSWVIEWFVVRYVERQGHSRAEVRTLYLRPPRWWPFWWPEAWRRPEDVYARLPKAIRRARALRLAGLGLTYSFAFFLALFFVFMHPTLRGPLRTALNVGLFAHLIGILGCLLGAAWQLERWGKRHGFTAEISANLGSQSTVARGIWDMAPYASVLEPAGRGKGPAEPEGPMDYLRAIDQAAGRLPEHARGIGGEALTAARELVAELKALDQEISTLARDLDPAELAAADRKLASLGAAGPNETDSRRQMRQLLEGQRDLMRRLGRQLEEASARRGHLLTLLRSLWLNLAALRAEVAADARRDGDTTGRIRAVIAEIQQHANALTEIRQLTEWSPSGPPETH